MSANINPSHNSGPSRKRSRKSNHPSNHKDDRKSCYGNVYFHERKSSGRPGSPHRYFEHSYTVSFQGSVDGDDDVSSSLTSTAAMKSDDTAAVVAEVSTLPTVPNNADGNSNQSITVPNNNDSTGNQVVHRHVNGLCIITAGNILQTILQQQQQNSTSSKGASQHQPTISSIKYLVQVAPDAQSAKGKLRAKNKKRKKNNNTSDSSEARDGNCGNVTPTDALCEVTLANGDKVVLKCCVQGTIIELNHRLANDGAEKKQQSSKSADVNVRGNSINDIDGNASLLLTDPLLDGYLAVIVPNRGTHLPTL